MSRRSLIAVNCDFDAGRPGARIRRKATLMMPYVEAILAAGGLPVPVPPSPPAILKHYVALADGFVFTGGLDYPPAYYGQKARPEVRVQTRQRSESDREFMRLAMSSRKPVLGICAGLQLMNIAAGGALIQHLPVAAKHKSVNPERDSSHRVALMPGSRLRKIFGANSLTVNSAHHQAADPKRLGRGLKIAALAPDGTVEGLELKKDSGRFFVFVQWHPERILDEAHRRAIFSAFLRACR